jgi:hypothetical protein
VRRDVLDHRDQFRVKVRRQLSRDELEKAYQLYLNVQQANTALNLQAYPFRLFEQMNQSDEWEFICHYLDLEGQPLAGVGIAHRSPRSYQGVLVGIDYRFSAYKVYKQVLYQVVMRAKALDKEILHLGVTANIEKKKLGAVQYPKVAYLQTDDHYQLEWLESMQGNKAIREEKQQPGSAAQVR